jgi:hypothetical protein
MAGWQGPKPVDRLAHGIDDPAEPPARRPHRRRRSGDDGATATPDAIERCKRHQQRIGAGKAHHLARNLALRTGLNDTRAPTDIAWIGPATSTINPRTPTTRP